SFFFQAEDGIRDGHVTGVQTCALPISTPANSRPSLRRPPAAGEQPPHPPAEVHRAYVASDPPEELKPDDPFGQPAPATTVALGRSEERRVGKEWRCRWSWYD